MLSYHTPLTSCCSKFQSSNIYNMYLGLDFRICCQQFQAQKQIASLLVLLIVVLLSLQRFVLSPNLSVRFLCDRKYCHIVSESFFAPPEQKTVYSSHIISYPYMNIDYLIPNGTGNRSLFCIIGNTDVKNLSHILTYLGYYFMSTNLVFPLKAKLSTEQYSD